MESDQDEPTAYILDQSRFWVQRVLVPLLVAVGVAGNTITVMVLTRRRMRSSTNVYLTALAIADIIHLLFVLLLSFKHYPNIHDRRYELYWRFFGLTHWLCDAASSTSVWLTVSFTVERYIAVCHPIKGKVLCTENRAKSIIVIVYIFCLLTTASTTFEYQLTLEESCIKQCPINEVNAAHHNAGNLNHESRNNGTIHHFLTLPHAPIADFKYDTYLQSQLESILKNCTSHPHIIYVPIHPHMFNITNWRTPFSPLLADNHVIHETRNSLETLALKIARNESDATEMPSNATQNTTCCLKKFTIDTESTSLGNNETYGTFMNWYSAIFFGLLPLVLIATFNCFLVHAVYMSQRRRRRMTNSQENISLSNENRITLMLIGVVVLFLVCQTPTASFLIYNNFHSAATKRIANIELILGNIFNFLMLVNGSCNFLLYCVLSKKFRSTFKKLFCERKRKRQDTIALSTTKRSSQCFNPYKHGIRRNASEYHTPRNLETQSLTSIPRSKSLMARVLGKAKSSDLNV